MIPETSAPVYSAINGDEFKRKVLDDVRVYLDNDTRFKKAIAYHRLKYTVKLLFSAYGQPEEEITVRGEAEARTLAEENRKLRDDAEAAEKEWRSRLERKASEYEQRIAALQAELLGSQAYNQELQDELRGRAVNVRSQPPRESEDGATEFSITIDQPVMEEPGRVRAELAASEERVGRAPGEAHSVNTEGKPVPPPEPANRGAVVGGGQRPTNVVGRPR